MTISRRDFLKGTAGAVGAAAVTSPAAALGQSDSSVMDYIRSNFNYDSGNEQFTDQAVDQAINALNNKAESVKDLLDAFQEYTDLRTIRADDLISIDRMTGGYGASAAQSMQQIYDQIGTQLPHDMMREWLTHHLYDDHYTEQAERKEWYNGPEQLAQYVTDLNVQFLYPDLLDLAFWDNPNKQIQPRSVDIDPAFVEELDRLAQQGEHGLRPQDRPQLGRRYLYEYMQNSGQEDLLFDRDPLVQTYQQIMWQRQSVPRQDRQQEIRNANSLGVAISSGDYRQAASQMSTTGLAYLWLINRNVTDMALRTLSDLVIQDNEDTSTEWGGRVRLHEDGLEFLHDPVDERGDDGRFRPDYVENVATEFTDWHAHAWILNNSGKAGPSAYDLAWNSPKSGIPKLLVTPLGQRGDTLRMNIDVYQSGIDCAAHTNTDLCPWAEPEQVDSFIVDLGIFEG